MVLKAWCPEFALSVNHIKNAIMQPLESELWGGAQWSVL